MGKTTKPNDKPPPKSTPPPAEDQASPPPANSSADIRHDLVGLHCDLIRAADLLERVGDTIGSKPAHAAGVHAARSVLAELEDLARRADELEPRVTSGGVIEALLGIHSLVTSTAFLPPLVEICAFPPLIGELPYTLARAARHIAAELGDALAAIPPAPKPRV